MMIGTTIRSYEIRDKLGEGGFGTVYRAHHTEIDREVAIKMISPVYTNRPEFIRQFETEAQLVARLEHPHIVPLYDFWREGNTGAFLVMRLLRGGSLQDLLKHTGTALDLEEVAEWLNQITGALSAAHRRGIVHQDIKPENILLDEDRNAYLTDFGIAQDLESGVNLAKMAEDSNIVHGSPAYISPEHFLQIGVDHKSDIYSLGLLLYEMLTGHKPWDDLDVKDAKDLLRQRFKMQKVPPLQKFNPALPEALNEVIWQASARKPVDRYEDVRQVADDFRVAIHGVRPSVHPKTMPGESDLLAAVSRLPVEVDNPYRGLRAFEEADSADFFGRGALITKLLERITETHQYSHFLAVIGPSGSGKSSVVKAGLIPAIRKGALIGLSNAFIAQITPGAHPHRQLEGAILRVATRADETLIGKLQSGDYKLSEIVSQALPPDDTRLILVIDQFEEVFTLVESEAKRLDFLQKIREAVTAPKSRVWVIITLRADFYDRPLGYSDFGDLLQARTEVVVPLSTQELEQTIRGPADRVGLILEPGLVERIVGDIGKQPNMLPLLQYTLTELFERRKQLEMTLDTYQEIGGITGSLVRRMEDIYSRFDPLQRDATRQIFLRLVTLGEGIEDTRRRAFQSELLSIGTDKVVIQEVLDAFGKYRLLSFDHDATTRAPTVEIAHEALIRGWSRLKEWLDKGRVTLRTYTQLVQATQEWLKSGKNRDFLARGARLAQLESLASNDVLVLTQDERTYLNESLAQRQRAVRRRKITFAGLAVTAVVMAVLAVFATFQSLRADTARQDADESAATAVAERDRANAARQDADHAAATAVAESDRANRESITSRSRELAASASALVNRNTPDLALLLSLEALEVAHTFEARNMLLTALQANPNLKSYFVGHTGVIRSVAYRPDGEMLASSSLDGTIILWDTETYRPVGVPLTGHGAWAEAIAFSPDGAILASGNQDGSVVLYDVTTGERLYDPLTGHNENVLGVAFSPDGSILASSGKDGTIRLWDVASGAPVRAPLRGHTGAIYSVVFSPDGALLASGGEDRAIRLWDAENDYASSVLEGHANWVFSLRFTPDSSVLVSGGADNAVRLWDMRAESPESVTLSGHSNAVRSIALSPSGRFLVSGDERGMMLIWDMASQTRIGSLTNVQNTPVRSIAFSPTGLIIAVGGEANAGTVWNLSPGVLLGHVLSDHTEEVVSVASHPADDSLIATAGGLDSDTAIRLWDTQTGTVRALLEAHTMQVTALAFDPHNPTRLVSASFDYTARLWNIETGDEIGRVALEDGLFAAAFSPDGTLVALGSNTGGVYLWDVSGSPEEWEITGAPLAGLTRRVLDVAFSPDGVLLAGASQDGNVLLWEVATGQQVGEPLGHPDAVYGVAFSPDGALLATGCRDTLVRLWDVATHTLIGDPLSGHTYWVFDVAFSPDGAMLASAGGDYSIILWDVVQRRPLGLPLTGHTDWVNALAFSAQGDYLLSGSRDKNVIVWETGLRLWQERACVIVNRSMNSVELDLYFRDWDSRVRCVEAES